MALTTLDAIRDAAAAIHANVHHTPLLSSRTLGDHIGAAAFIKAESLQKTGSFKVRGALNRVRALTAEERRRGLVTVSAGNHAQALAWAAAAEGVPCTVAMPADAFTTKVDATRGYGARVVLEGDVGGAFDACFRLRDEEGLVFVHPFDDPMVIAGQGTVGLEVLDDAPDVDLVVVPVGGGGLISGIATAIKALRPEARVIGVEPEGAPCLRRALDAGAVVRLDTIDTIADGLAPPFAGALTLEHASTLVDDVVLITDDDIRDGMRFGMERARLVLEPAGAAAIAALLARKVDTEGRTVVAIASGGNVDIGEIAHILDPDAREP